jgi:hypothetical protein
MIHPLAAFPQKGFAVATIIIRQTSLTAVRAIDNFRLGATLRAVHFANASYDSVCDKTNLIINHLQQGKNPFAIRWESNSNNWGQIAKEMRHDLMSVEFQIHSVCKDKVWTGDIGDKSIGRHR